MLVFALGIVQREDLPIPHWLFAWVAAIVLVVSFFAVHALWPLCGHVAAPVLAHDRALALYDDPSLVLRSQYWMLGVMVGFTSLALWLLAQSTA